MAPDVVRRLLAYDPSIGIFTWKIGRPKCVVGAIAGGLDPDGYWRIGLLGRQWRAHNLAWLYVHGRWPDGEVDHRNLMRSDNRLDNLREGTRRENIANSDLRSTNTSGFKGVYFHRQAGKWCARIRSKEDGMRSLGLYETAEEAGAVYKQAAQKMYGEFARLS